MPHNRFFLDQDLSRDDTFLLQEGEAHHLLRVMRAEKGDLVELVNGRNQLIKGKVDAIGKKEVSIQKIDLISIPIKPPSFILAQSLIEMARLETIVEKTTELGVDEIWLFPALFSEKKRAFT